MIDAPSGESPSGTNPEDRLESWKEIAAYLRRDVTTVQRWEKREGLPVHRHLHERIGSVYASKAELEVWVRRRSLQAHPGDDSEAPPPDSETPARVATVRAWVRTWATTLAVLAALLITGIYWAYSAGYFWRNPIAGAQWRNLTGLEAEEQSAALSRDGKFIAFLSDRDGSVDVWLTQVGTGRFHNLTKGMVSQNVNRSVRMLSFSPDGSLVNFWTQGLSAGSHDAIGIWAVPVLGGQPGPYWDGVAEFDWSRDANRIVYHTPDPGDPLFVSTGKPQSGLRPIYTAPSGFHSHFPVWSPDGSFVYFVSGKLPDKLDIWRIPVEGGSPEQITSHGTTVSHPVLLDDHTLLYLATDPDGSGPWLYGMDPRRRVAHRLSSGVERFTSLAASGDGKRLVLTRSTHRNMLWRVPVIEGTDANQQQFQRIALNTSTGFAPRLGPGYLLFASTSAQGVSLWKMRGDSATELWEAQGARWIGGPSISEDGSQIAFSVSQDSTASLYAMNADGTNVRVVTNSIALRGSPAWAPDGNSILTAADREGVPRILQVPVKGGQVNFLVDEHAEEPCIIPDRGWLLYSGPDIGTKFEVKARKLASSADRFPGLSLSRGPRRMRYLAQSRSIVFLRGELQQKNMWMRSLETGIERQLTHFAAGIQIQDFDIAPDASSAVLEVAQEHTEVVQVDLAGLW